MQAIPGVEYNSQGGYYNITQGCEAVATLPDISFKLGDAIYNLPARLWTQQVNPQDGDAVLAFPLPKTCIMPKNVLLCNSNYSLNILGNLSPCMLSHTLPY